MRKKGFFSKKKAKTFLKGSPGMPAYLKSVLYHADSIIFDNITLLILLLLLFIIIVTYSSHIQDNVIYRK